MRSPGGKQEGQRPERLGPGGERWSLLSVSQAAQRGPGGLSCNLWGRAGGGGLSLLKWNRRARRQWGGLENSNQVSH